MVQLEAILSKFKINYLVTYLYIPKEGWRQINAVKFHAKSFIFDRKT